jgi:signal transduction histidine kinase
MPHEIEPVHTTVAEPLPTVRAGMLPTVFIVLSLIALLVGPFVMQSRVRALSEEIQTAADPARTGVTRIQYLLARQTSALRGYVISGEPEYLRQFNKLTDEETLVYAQLEPLAARLGPEVLARLEEVRDLSSAWRADLAEELRRIEDGTTAPDSVPFDRGEYLATLDAAGRFDEAVSRATRGRQRAIRAAENRALIVQAALVALAMVAAGMTALLGLRVHRTATIAEARRMEAERALDETARAVQAKERLIRGVTHDVKNPLGAADGYAELLELGLRGPLTPEQAHTVTGIRRSIHGGLSIIGDLLELARAEGGSLPINETVVSLSTLVTESVEDYRGAADALGHRLELDLPPDDVLVRTDPIRVKQMLGNLLWNAIKYTPPGGNVRVEMERIPSGDTADEAVVRGVDSGPGIPEAYRDRIFDEFERIPGSTASGHGLGLAIARRVGQLLGGDLTLRSDGASGSTFVLSLPALRDDPEPVGPR